MSATELFQQLDKQTEALETLFSKDTVDEKPDDRQLQEEYDLQ